MSYAACPKDTYPPVQDRMAETVKGLKEYIQALEWQVDSLKRSLQDLDASPRED